VQLPTTISSVSIEASGRGSALVQVIHATSQKHCCLLPRHFEYGSTVLQRVELCTSNQHVVGFYPTRGKSSVTTVGNSVTKQYNLVPAKGQ